MVGTIYYTPIMNSLTVYIQVCHHPVNMHQFSPCGTFLVTDLIHVMTALMLLDNNRLCLALMIMFCIVHKLDDHQYIYEISA